MSSFEVPPEIPSEQPPATPPIDWLRKTGAVLGMGATFGIGGAVASAMIPNETMLGPHKATVQIRPPGPLEVEMVPFGKVKMQSPVRVGSVNALGMKVSIEEIPGGDGTILGANEITAYERFLTSTGRETAFKDAAEAVQDRAKQYGLIGCIGGIGLYFLAGARGREIASEVAHSRRLRLLATAALAANLLAADTPAHPTPEMQSNPVLEAAGLPGIQVEGKILETLINKYGADLLKHIRETDQYYREIRQNVDAALQTKLTEEQQNPSNLARQLQEGSAEQILWISDNHCNLETAALAAHLANTLDVTMVINSGDDSMGGTQAEKICLSVLPNNVAEDIPLVIALGNHDDRKVTGQQAIELGYHNLAGSPIDIKGYRILGDADTMRSAFGVPYHQVGEVSVAEHGKQIADTACKAGDISLVVMHTPDAAKPSAEQGCAPLVLSGHSHEVKGPTPHHVRTLNNETITSYSFVNGTSGGAAHDKLTFKSKLGQQATFVSLVFDKASKLPLGYRIFTVNPDKQVHIGDLQAFDPLPTRTTPLSMPTPGASATQPGQPEPVAKNK